MTRTRKNCPSYIIHTGVIGASDFTLYGNITPKIVEDYPGCSFEFSGYVTAVYEMDDEDFYESAEISSIQTETLTSMSKALDDAIGAAINAVKSQDKED